MGMDVMGVKPRSKKGEYFRNNCWWWRPLWKYVVENGNVDEDTAHRGCYNDGGGLNDDDARELGYKLKELYESGHAKEYEEQYKQATESLEDEECELCKGTGQRNDEIVQGKCNGCGGKGTKRPWACSYPFEADNIKDFAEFCIDSGGFEIW